MVSAGLEDPAPLGLAKIRKIVNLTVNFTVNGSKIQFLTYFPRFSTPHTYAKLILMKKHIFYHKMKFL